MADTNNQYNFLDYEGLSLFWSNIKDIIEDNELVTATSLTDLDTRVDSLEELSSNLVISKTYSELKALRDNNNLVPGQQYRITDYATTTVQENTKSAGHQFDIIVIADSENTLNEVARAIHHEEGSYFADYDLNAWQLWYCLNNDADRFAWAATNGKGVIYRMIDENNNDCPYDFKNIQFKHPNDSTTYPDYYYTFSTVIDGNVTDHSLLQGYCYGNTMKEYIESNKQKLNKNVFLNTAITNKCYNNSFGNNCYNNSFGNKCYNNSFGNDCYSNSFGNSCYYSSFGNNCYDNSFGNTCSSNSFGNSCYSNSFGNTCSTNSFINSCTHNSFGNYCQRNSFGNACQYNFFGNYFQYNSFGNYCQRNSFRVSADTTSTLKDYVYYIHFDDGCVYNVIWNADTTSSGAKLQNINVNRGVSGKYSSHNMINITTLNSEQEINVNQVDGIVSIGEVLSITYTTLKSLRDNSQFIPGRQYRIIDYVTTTSQADTQSAGHQFDVIVTADSANTLNEVARAIQHEGDTYFTDYDLNAWQLWYCLDNDADRFAWAGDAKVGEIEHKYYDSSECTINSNLIDGNAFITPFNFDSCVWVDSDNNDIPYMDGHVNHDINELIYEWGYFTDDNDNTHLCLYKSDAELYEEEGHPDYNDKYLYRGVVSVDGTDYDYWQKWDSSETSVEGVGVDGYGNHVYATTDRIVSNPEAYTLVTEIEDIYVLGKGVIYRMIDENNNDCPYDFKNIQFKHPNDSTTYPDYYYTFSTVIDGTITDHSLLQGYCYGNTMKEYINLNKQQLNKNVFLNTSNTYACYNNFFGNICYNNSFGGSCSSNSFGMICHSNSFGNNCHANSFGSLCNSNSFKDNCHSNYFGNSCSSNSFEYSCIFNSFGNTCSSNSFGNGCQINLFGNACGSNSFGDGFIGNSFGNNCSYNSFRVSADKTSALKDYVYNNHFDDGCSYNVIWNDDTTSNIVQLKNINVNRGVSGKSSAYNMINITTLNSEQEINVNQVDGIVSIGEVLSITYATLKSLRDNSQLIPGRQYRIIDYVTYTLQENTQSAGHQFDIIVTADSENKLNEVARAIQHEGDTYFADYDLNAWKIWYYLDNDVDRFAWALTKGKRISVDAYGYNVTATLNGTFVYNDTIYARWDTLFLGEESYILTPSEDVTIGSTTIIYNVANDQVLEGGTITSATIYENDGKGVIYRMIDEFSNDVPYDFKNIQFKHPNDSTTYPDYYYTFSTVIGGTITDFSLTQGYCYNNVIKEYINSQKLYLNSNIFINTSNTSECYSNSFGNDCHDNSFGKNNYGNSFGNNCYNNSFGNDCYKNSFGIYCLTNSFGNNFYFNSFGNCCGSNSFGNYCSSNSFENQCSHNSFGNNCLYNSFGNHCESNSFGNYCKSNSFGNDCKNNSFGIYCDFNSFGNKCYDNSFGNYCESNSFGNYCESNDFGIYCDCNSFGNRCRYNSFRVSADKTSTLKGYVYNNHFDDGCSYNVIWNALTTNSSKKLQNINVNRGVSGSSSAYNMINMTTLNQNYELQVANNSDGEIRIYCEANLI